MVSSTTKIVGASIGIGGSIAGSAAGIYYLTKQPSIENKGAETKNETGESHPQPITKKTVANLLSEKGKSIITTGETEKWNTKWTTFKGDYTQAAPTGAWSIEGWSTKKDTEEGLNAFKKLCTDNTTKEAENQDAQIFKDIMKYCVE